MKKFTISPSILSADFARLGEEVTNVIAAGADMIHFDVMDNHYVPNLTIGPAVCQSLRNYGITCPLDVHLMVRPVDDLIISFAQAGASRITIHPETTHHLERSLSLINHHGCQVGLAFNPTTPLDYLQYVLDKLDSILIMSVNPGFGGQKFIANTLDKIRATYQLINKTHPQISIQVDGGINVANISQIAHAGADNFVAGSAIFNSGDYQQAITKMRQQLATSG